MPDKLVCPVCGKPMFDANTRCSGGFLDRDHPLNVRPIIGTPPVRPADASSGEDRP